MHTSRLTHYAYFHDHFLEIALFQIVMFFIRCLNKTNLDLIMSYQSVNERNCSFNAQAPFMLVFLGRVAQVDGKHFTWKSCCEHVNYGQ